MRIAVTFHSSPLFKYEQLKQFSMVKNEIDFVYKINFNGEFDTVNSQSIPDRTKN